MSIEVSAQPSTRLKLEFADGLRGLCAVIVAAFHAVVFTGYNGDGEEAGGALATVLGYGHFGVAIFIVLSGYVLMLPLAQKQQTTLPKGWRHFMGRRARRLLPPYYAALGFFTILALTVPVLREPSDTAWDTKIPITWDGFLAHLALIHNLNKDWIYMADGPMWSVATEWQIYLLMPLMLLPLLRLGGYPAALVGAFALGMGVVVIFPSLYSAHPWYAGLFVLGMAAATFTFNDVLAKSLGWLTAVAWVGVVGVFALFRDVVEARQPFSEPMLGVAVAMLLVWMARRSIAGQPSPLHRVFEARPLLKLGLFSYSIYLFHSPLLALGNLLTIDIDMSDGARLALMLLVMLPLSIAASYVAYLLVERRFMTSHQRAVRAEVTSAS